MVGSVLNPIRRVISPINPFASQQVASKDSYAIADRWGNGWFKNPVYVKGTTFSNLWPNHYNPSTDGGKDKQTDAMHGEKAGPGVTGTLGNFNETLPRGCHRAKQAYDRCKMVNGKEKCSDEGNYVLGVCPNWAVAEMASLKNFEKKVMLIDTCCYRYMTRRGQTLRARRHLSVP